MKRWSLALAFALAACGVDGPPVPPAKAAPGITVSGTAEIGIVSRR
ncbi:argininosuccinate lyase [Phaeovulum veldkampii]|uniref:Argininosuccinate lyase n=1 Tax=Phaeovulum veldkampii DSM 11550 TaxID=1185920 RepID=A0A2T4JGY5_9RHOB|nr:argininosuccinate lyase [Phaeovulum veldkampii]NCU20597.1 argininosuccinate lyase [Candidatus Falkowbacteria bacterium]PTE17174.1 argininosuccinate lyase [Phaeovulum veldkampii DSM 11550]TDQ61428.1 hypothetical protein EV658_104142 [Phaeovulum veldkampii DSM 11550]